MVAHVWGWRPGGREVGATLTTSLPYGRLSPFPNADLCIGLFAFAAVDELGIFEPIVVVAGIALGLIAWAAKMN